MSSYQQIAEPPACAFDNWDKFYPLALQYHLATHPKHDCVVDRIETFKQFMPEDITYYLGGFVRTHPRFCTPAGWDQWVADVTEMFRLHKIIYDGDRTCDKPPAWVKKVRAFFKKPVEITPTVNDLTLSYQKRKLGLRGLWTGLDKLVSEGILTPVEQRQHFWNTLPETERTRLVELCCYFDPEDELWEKVESDAAKLGEQTLSRLMEFMILDEIIANTPWRLSMFLILVFAQLLVGLMFLASRFTVFWATSVFFDLYMSALYLMNAFSFLVLALRMSRRATQLKAKRGVLLLSGAV